MRYLTISILILSLSLSVWSQAGIANHTPQNPALPPLWGLHIPDPEAKVYDGRVYVYGSRDEPEQFGFCSDDYHVISSGDLLSWKDHGVSFSLESVPEELRKDPKTNALWAPDVLKHPGTGKYYLYSCMNEGKDQKLLVSVSDSPTGPFGDTKAVLIDGKEEIKVIDPAVLVDDDGKAYIAWPFKIGRLDPKDFSRVIGKTVVDMTRWMPADNSPFEGPSLHKRGDIYYFIYVQNNGVKTPGNRVPLKMGYMTASKPLGPYHYRGLIIDNTPYLANINVHGSIVGLKDQYYVFYHNLVPDIPHTRDIWIEPLEFNEDGTIIQAELSSSGARGSFVAGDRIQAASACIFPDKGNAPQYISRKENYAIYSFSTVQSCVGFRYVNFSGIKAGMIHMNIQSDYGGDVLELTLDTHDGEFLAEIPIPSTWGEWKVVTAPLVKKGIEGKRSIFIKLKKKGRLSNSVKLDWFGFE